MHIGKIFSSISRAWKRKITALMTVLRKPTIYKPAVILMFFFLVYPFSCVEPFKPDFDAYEKALVAEGSITNAPGPYEVRLSETAGNYHPRFRPVSSATVIIEDDLGNESFLNEKSEGHYFSDPNELQGEIGRQYRLKITLEDGRTYRSDFSEIKESLPIDSFYAQAETAEGPFTGELIPGYRFFADIPAKPDSDTYLAWRGTETYEYTSSFTIDYIYDEEGLRPFETPYIYYRCWKTQSIHQTIVLKSPAGLSQTHITVPLNHSHLSKFNIKYSLLLKQYVIDQSTYDYLNKLNKLNESQGSLYETQPFRLHGNIKNVNDPDEYVVGFFFAAGQSEKRIFLSDDDYAVERCDPDFRAAAFIGMISPDFYPVFVASVGGRQALAPKSCFDCRLKGGLTQQPDFWE